MAMYEVVVMIELSVTVSVEVDVVVVGADGVLMAVTVVDVSARLAAMSRETIVRR